MPAKLTSRQLRKAQAMAKKVTDYLGGAGLFGVEFFVTKKDIYFSELSPRPHDTGMVTLISQSLSEFDLHLRAVLGLPIPQITYYGPSASSVILANERAESYRIEGVDKAMAIRTVDVRLFGKPTTRKYRRMGVALARGKSVMESRKRANLAAKKVRVV